ncbi:MAG: hypothetical protein WBU20_01890, partial [Candidatus Acidiferrum sp.]
VFRLAIAQNPASSRVARQSSTISQERRDAVSLCQAHEIQRRSRSGSHPLTTFAIWLSTFAHLFETNPNISFTYITHMVYNGAVS